MSFGTALMSAIGGYGQGRAARRQENEANTFQQKQLDEARAAREAQLAADREYQAQQLGLERGNQEISRAQLAVTQRNSGINPLTGQPFPYAMDPKIAALIRNRGGTPTPYQMNDYFRQAIADANRQGRPDIAATLEQQQQHFTGSVYGGDLDQARSAQARATAIKEKAQAKAIGTQQQTALAIAHGHDWTSIQKAGMQYQNAREIAGYNGQMRAYIANLAGAYHLAGVAQGNEIKLAIDKANNEVKIYGDQLGAINDVAAPPGLGDPGSTAGVGNPTLPVVAPSDLPKPPWQKSPGGVAPAPAPTEPVVDADSMKPYLEAMKGHTRAEVRAALDALVSHKRISPEMAHALWAKAPPDVPPVPVGGAGQPGAAQPPSPFPAYLR